MTKKMKVEETTETKIYYFSHTFLHEGKAYLKWNWYELTEEQVKLFSKTVDLCDCPPKLWKKWDCWCKK